MLIIEYTITTVMTSDTTCTVATDNYNNYH